MTIDCTRKWIGNAAYIVYVTSLSEKESYGRHTFVLFVS